MFRPESNAFKDTRFAASAAAEAAAPVPLSALSERVDSRLDQFRDRIESAVFRDDIPLLGAEFADQAGTVLAFVDDLKAQMQAALLGIGTARASATEIAEAINATAGDIAATIRADGTLAIEFSHRGLADIVTPEAAAALAALGAGVSLQAALDLDAQIEAGLILVLDPDAGTVKVDTSAATEFSLDLTGGLLPDDTVALGFLDGLLGAASARDGIDLGFAVDLDGAAVNTTLSGEAFFGRRLETRTASEVLPSISADLNLGFSFEAVTLERGVTLDAAGSIGLENITLDMGGLADFLDSVLGQIADIANTFPLGTVIDILTAPIPVIDDIAPGSLDKTGDGSITAADFILAFGDNGDNIGFVTAIEALFEVLETIDDLRDLADTVDLGDLVLSGEATASFGAEFDATMPGVGADLRADLAGLLSGTGLDALLNGVLPDGADATDRLLIPLITDPLDTIGGLLLNGFYSEPVTLVAYDLPPMGFSVNPSIPFSVGPLSFFVGGRFSAVTDFGVGYDTEGFAPGTVDVPSGFFITTVDGGRIDPFATLGFGMEAGGGVGVGVAKVSIVGGVGGEVDLFLAGGGEKVRLGDLLPCLFDPITGEIVASLDIEVKVGVGPLSISDRVNLGETVLAQFGFDPCDTVFDPATFRFTETGLAAALSSGALALNVGARSSGRALPGRIDLEEGFRHLSDAELDVLRGTGQNLRQVDEVFHVARSLPEDGAAAGALAVSAFGVYEIYTPDSQFSRIRGEGGAGDDRLSVEAGLDIAATLRGDAGKDTLIGGAAADLLQGGRGGDMLVGNDGRDRIEGQGGDDLLIGGKGADTLDGGAGLDEADYSESSAAVSFRVINRGGVEMLEGSGGDAEGDRLIAVEHIKGSVFDDRLLADPLADSVLQGMDGDDTLTGGQGDDLLAGGRGGDAISGGGGQDAVSYAFSDAGVLIDLDAGLVWGGEASGDTLDSIEIYQLSWYGDTFQGLTATRQRDTVYGFEGNDWIDGGAGKDFVDAGGGDDTVLGGAEGDTLDGGSGHDLLSYFHLFPPSLRTGPGVDVSLADGTAALADGSSPQVDALAAGEAGNSSFEDVTGTRRDDTLEGDDAANTLRGEGGDDTLRGLGGDDTLVGGAGADGLEGGAGFDLADYSGSDAAVDVSLATGKGTGGHAKGDTLASVEALRGSAFGDTLTGSILGNDLDVGAYNGYDTDSVFGRGGIDRLIAHWSAATEDLEVVRFVGGAGEIRYLDGIDRVILTDFDGIENMSVTTGSGDDIVASIFDGPAVDEPGFDNFDGDDYIHTGAGDDTINAGSGNDQVFGGTGDDTVSRTKATAAETFVIDGGAGFDTLIADLSYDTAGVTLASYSTSEENHARAVPLAGGGVFSGFEILADITTGSGDDTLVQLGFADNLFTTGLGADSVTLDWGNNTVHAGDDAAVDTLTLDYSGEVRFALSSDLRLTVAGSNLLSVTLDQGSAVRTSYASSYHGFERLFLTATDSADDIDGLHGGDGDIIHGGRGNDTINGLDGDDALFGDKGADVLVGGLGADTLDGGDGRDTLTAGVRGRADGIDVLTGGAGRDRFVLGDDDGSLYGAFAGDFAQIRDFDAATDRIQLHGTSALYSVSQLSGDRTRITLDATGEKVAVLHGVSEFTLDSPAVRFVGDSPAAPDGGTAAPAATGPVGALRPTLEIPIPPSGPGFEIHDYGVIDPIQALIVDALDDVATRSVTFEAVTLGGDTASVAAFSDAPFGLEDGIVLSTGVARDLAAPNTADGSEARGALAGSEVALSFDRIGTTAEGSVVFRADLSGLAGGLTSLTLTDSLNLEGAVSLFSGFDLDGLFLSADRIDGVGGAVDLTGASVLDLFDFSPAGTRLSPGTMRDPGLFTTLAGTVNGMIDEGFARLGAVDYDGNVANGGAVSLGDGGAVTFELTETAPTDGPLYLYVAEAFDAGEALSGTVRVTDADSSSVADASTDLGVPGADGDRATVTADVTVDFKGGRSHKIAELFNIVIVSEELPEFAGAEWQDLIDIRVNGLSAAVLADGRQASLQNLAASPFGAFAPELSLNPVGDGAHAETLAADAYTTILRVQAPILDGLNRFEFTVADLGDGLRDSAVFLSALTRDTLRGDSGDNRLRGSSADDLMIGKGGSDVHKGGHGWDTYRFSAGSIAQDVVDERGGSGLDRIELGVAPGRITFTRDGDDLLLHLGGTGSGRDIRIVEQYAGDLPAPMVEVLHFDDGTEIDLAGPVGFTGGAGDDRAAAALIGSDLGETIAGRGGADVLSGLGGADRLKGGAGDDRLIGGADDDRLGGGAGDDRLAGGTGNDRLTGGGGRDVFVFATGGGIDRITDFTGGGAGQDRLDLSRLESVTGFRDLMAHHVAVRGDHLVIDGLNGDRIVLAGARGVELDAGDFLF